MSSRKTAGRRGTTKKRAQRATSNVFAMFNQDQIQEFKEAFNMVGINQYFYLESLYCELSKNLWQRENCYICIAGGASSQ